MIYFNAVQAFDYSGHQDSQLLHIYGREGRPHSGQHSMSVKIGKLGVGIYSLYRHIQKQKGVTFAGYKMPHPLEHKFVLKVQTEKPLTPPQALERTVDQLIGDLAILEERLRVGGLDEGTVFIFIGRNQTRLSFAGWTHVVDINLALINEILHVKNNS